MHSASRRAVAILVCALALTVQCAAGLGGHHAFRTNAFDLSVFDYALWTTATGAPVAYVPMFGYSLFAQHFMPTLLLLAPLPALFGSPAYLIVVQTLLYAGAAFLLFELARRRTTETIALALMVAFLFSRRSYSAVSSYFYIESAEPILVFGLVLALWSERRVWYWVLLGLALGCKEDVAMYLAAFGGLLILRPGQRRTGALTVSVAAAWLLFTMAVVIPHFRTAYSLEGANHFVDARYGVSGVSGALTLAGRVLSTSSLAKVATILSATAFVSLLAPAWLAVAVPGLLLNLAAVPGSVQAELTGHNLWPILPWVFVAAAVGAARLPARHRRWYPWLIVVVSCIDAPLPRALARTPWHTPPDAQVVASELERVPVTASVTAQPNLIPHLARRLDMHSLGAYEPATLQTDYVLLSTVGDLWPFDVGPIERRSRALAADPRYEQAVSGPLLVFRRRQAGAGAHDSR